MIRSFLCSQTGDRAVYTVYRLRYDPDPGAGWEDCEETTCIFVGFHRLMDFSYGNGFLYWRREGEDWVRRVWSLVLC